MRGDAEWCEDKIMRAFDRWPAYHPDAVKVAKFFPGIFQRWCDEVDSGQRVWLARTKETDEQG